MMSSSIPCPFHVQRISTTAATQLGELLLRSWHWLCTWRPPWSPWTGRFGAQTASHDHRIIGCLQDTAMECNGMQWIRGNFVKLVLIGAFGISKSGYRVDLKNVKHIFWKCRGFYCFNQLQHLGPVKSPQLPGRFRSKLLPPQRRENRRCGSNGHDVE